ncbi:hypothetical protein BDW59DRAFT_156534 [Aspergillus cavernicola]|uniref:Uncharacterized protein n=1 Tax=Aspergillus cavernicola TaxID=176166 RepID=A0ABR4J112_9EURO
MPTRIILVPARISATLLERVAIEYDSDMESIVSEDDDVSSWEGLPSPVGSGEEEGGEESEGSSLESVVRDESSLLSDSSDASSANMVSKEGAEEAAAPRGVKRKASEAGFEEGPTPRIHIPPMGMWIFGERFGDEEMLRRRRAWWDTVLI